MNFFLSSMKSQKKRIARWCHHHYRYLETSHDVPRKHYERRVFCGIQRDEFTCRRNGERRVIRRKAKIIISQGRKSEGSTPTNNQWFLCFFSVFCWHLFFSFSENIGHHTNPRPYTHRNPIIFPQLLLLQFFFAFLLSALFRVSFRFFFRKNDDFLRFSPAISIRHIK